MRRRSTASQSSLLRFGDLVLHSHLGIGGSWHVGARSAPGRRPRSQAWAVLAAREGQAAQYGGPTLRVLTAARVRRDPQLARLGPDILAADFQAAPVASAMRGADPERGLGDALLDQSLIAGIGNIFKSEACFAARVDPWRPLGELSEQELCAVLVAARGEMLDAVARGERRAFAIYRRRGPCPRCGGAVRSRGQGEGNRTTYWCPACQG